MSREVKNCVKMSSLEVTFGKVTGGEGSQHISWGGKGHHPVDVTSVAWSTWTWSFPNRVVGGLSCEK